MAVPAGNVLGSEPAPTSRRHIVTMSGRQGPAAFGGFVRGFAGVGEPPWNGLVSEQ